MARNASHFSSRSRKEHTFGLRLLHNWNRPRLTNDKRYVRSHHNRPPLESPFVINWAVCLSEYFSVSAADRASQAAGVTLSRSSPYFIHHFSASFHDSVSDTVLAYRPPASHEVWWRSQLALIHFRRFYCPAYCQTVIECSGNGNLSILYESE